MDGWVIAIFVPTIIFMLIIAPAWLWMHYRHKQRTESALSEQERHELEALTLQSERMLERIDTLEAILDAQAPDWRKQEREA